MRWTWDNHHIRVPVLANDDYVVIVVAVLLQRYLNVACVMLMGQVICVVLYESPTIHIYSSFWPLMGDVMKRMR